MVESTNVHLVAARAVTLDAFVFLRMIEPLDRRVALVALQALLAVVPAHSRLQGVAVLGGVLEQVGWSSEVSRVMRVDATFRVVAIFLGWTPTRFVEEHEKDVAFLFSVNIVQSLVQIVELKQAFGHEVILDALVLKVSVHCLDQLQIVQSEAH